MTQYDQLTEREQTAIGWLQVIPTEILAAGVRGELDLEKLARLELASRGIDSNGKWVGFKNAAAQ